MQIKYDFINTLTPMSLGIRIESLEKIGIHKIKYDFINTLTSMSQCVSETLKDMLPSRKLLYFPSVFQA